MLYLSGVQSYYLMAINVMVVNASNCNYACTPVRMVTVLVNVYWNRLE